MLGFPWGSIFEEGERGGREIWEKYFRFSDTIEREGASTGKPRGRDYGVYL